jgi:hypothetical protein
MAGIVDNVVRLLTDRSFDETLHYEPRIGNRTSRFACRTTMIFDPPLPHNQKLFKLTQHRKQYTMNPLISSLLFTIELPYLWKELASGTIISTLLNPGHYFSKYGYSFSLMVNLYFLTRFPLARFRYQAYGLNVNAMVHVWHELVDWDRRNHEDAPILERWEQLYDFYLPIPGLDPPPPPSLFFSFPCVSFAVVLRCENVKARPIFQIALVFQ